MLDRSIQAEGPQRTQKIAKRLSFGAGLASTVAENSLAVSKNGISLDFKGKICIDADVYHRTLTSIDFSEEEAAKIVTIGSENMSKIVSYVSQHYASEIEKTRKELHEMTEKFKESDAKFNESIAEMEKRNREYAEMMKKNEVLEREYQDYMKCLDERTKAHNLISKYEENEKRIEESKSLIRSTIRLVLPTEVKNVPALFGSGSRGKKRPAPSWMDPFEGAVILDLSEDDEIEVSSTAINETGDGEAVRQPRKQFAMKVPSAKRQKRNEPEPKRTNEVVENEDEIPL